MAAGTKLRNLQTGVARSHSLHRKVVRDRAHGSIRLVGLCHCVLSLTANAIILSPTEIEQCWPGRAVSRDVPSSETVPSALVTPTVISIVALPSGVAVGVTTQFVPPPRSKRVGVPSDSSSMPKSVVSALGNSLPSFIT